MLHEDYIEIRLPFIADIDEWERSDATFIWNSVKVYQIWKHQNGSDRRNKRQDDIPMSAVAAAHVMWLEKNPECILTLREVVSAVEHLSYDGMEIPPAMNAFLTSMYEELIVIIDKEIRGNGRPNL